MIKKTMDEEQKTTLVSFPYDSLGGLPINKAGKWLYFHFGRCLYRVNMDGEEEKELVYRASLPIASIQLYDGDVLVNMDESNSVYIKKDGTVMELGKED